MRRVAVDVAACTRAIGSSHQPTAPAIGLAATARARGLLRSNTSSSTAAIRIPGAVCTWCLPPHAGGCDP